MGFRTVENECKFGKVEGGPSLDRNRIARVVIHCDFCSNVQLGYKVALSTALSSLAHLSVCS